MRPCPPLWPGATIAILAPGPTLTAEAAAYCRGRARVVVVNDAVQLAPWADVLYSSDRGWYPARRGCPEFLGLKFAIGSQARKANGFAAYPEIHVLRHSSARGLCESPEGLCHGHNSGYAAINLAVHLGAARIVLLGYTLGRIGGAAHFAGARPPASGHTADMQYAIWRARFADLVAPLAARGIAIVNATPESRLECFVRAPLAEAVPASAEAAA